MASLFDIKGKKIGESPWGRVEDSSRGLSSHKRVSPDPLGCPKNTLRACPVTVLFKPQVEIIR
jgi:hypothetical protein